MNENMKYWCERVDRMKEKTGKDFCVVEGGHGDYQPWTISVADHLPPMAKVVYRTDQQRVSLHDGMASTISKFNRVV